MEAFVSNDTLGALTAPLTSFPHVAEHCHNYTYYPRDPAQLYIQFLYACFLDGLTSKTIVARF